MTELYKAAGWFMPKRYTYIIDPKGEIVNVYKKFDISSHSENIIKFLREQEDIKTNSDFH